MKKGNLIKLTFLISFILCLIITLAACNNDQENKDTSGATDATGDVTEKDTASQDIDKPDITIQGNTFTIFENGEYNCPIICAENASETEKALYNKIRNKLKDITGVLPPFATDFKAYNDDGSSRQRSAILIGNTNYTESKQVYNSLEFGSTMLKMVSNKLVISFTSTNGAEDVYMDFLRLINGYSKEKVSFKTTSLPISKVSDTPVASFPALPNTEAEFYDCGDDTHMIRIANTTKEQYEDYKKVLTENGYRLINSRSAAQNYYTTFTKDDHYIYVYYKLASRSIRAIMGPTKHLPDYSAEKTVTKKIAEPTLTLLHQGSSEIGLGMVYRLADGRFVIFDGGNKDYVYSVLKEQNKLSKITIAAWFISHPHSDHHNAFNRFVNSYSGEVNIETVVFNYATQSTYHNLSKADEKTNTSMTMIRNTISKKLPNVKIIKAHTGQLFYFGGVSFEVLHTHEDIAPTPLEYLNDSSLIVRANFEGESILMLADATYTVGAVLISAFGDYLKSDFVQLAHHGVWASYHRLYAYVDAEVLIWPSNSAGAKQWITDEAVVAALKPATDVYLPNYENIVIKFPYTNINNKDSFIANHS